MEGHTTTTADNRFGWRAPCSHPAREEKKIGVPGLCRLTRAFKTVTELFNSSEAKPTGLSVTY